MTVLFSRREFALLSYILNRATMNKVTVFV